MDLRILSADDVRRALPMAEAIDAVDAAYRQLSAGRAIVPLRARVEVAAEEAVTLVMPALLMDTQDLAVKIVSVFPRNSGRGLPTIHGLVIVVDAASGEPRALLEGSSLTAIRTGAGSGSATHALARPQVRVGAVFGSGAQARTQLEAMATARRFERIWIFSLDQASAREMVEQMAGAGPIPSDLRLAESPRQAVERADVICTATTSSTPVFSGADIATGAHINAIGGFTPSMAEVDSTAVRRASVFVDSRAAVLAEAGELLQPIQRGEITADWIRGELGDVLAGRIPGRTSPDEITLFKSVGVAVQDAAAAARALSNAARLGLGQQIRI